MFFIDGWLPPANVYNAIGAMEHERLISGTVGQADRTQVVEAAQTSFSELLRYAIVAGVLMPDGRVVSAGSSFKNLEISKYGDILCSSYFDMKSGRIGPGPLMEEAYSRSWWRSVEADYSKMPKLLRWSPIAFILRSIDCPFQWAALTLSLISRRKRVLWEIGGYAAGHMVLNAEVVDIFFEERYGRGFLGNGNDVEGNSAPGRPSKVSDVASILLEDFPNGREGRHWTLVHLSVEKKLGAPVSLKTVQRAMQLVSEKTTSDRTDQL